jgi:CHAT domain-containing protein/tetratricopeptide (TPR) repeat protein
MLKRFILIPAMTASLVVLLSSPLMAAQSEERGIALFKEGQQRYKTAQSKQDLEEAHRKFEEALVVFERTRAEAWQATTLNEMGVVYWSWDQHAKALEYYEKSMKIRRKIGDVQGQGVTLSTMGIAYGAMGQYAKALEYYEKSLEIRRKVGDVRGEGVTLNNMGAVYHDWGQYAKALEHFEKSLEIESKVGDVENDGRTLNNMAFVYESWGQYAKALEYYEKSMEIMRKVGDVRREGLILGNIAYVYAQQEEYDKSLAKYQESLAIYEKIGVPTKGTKDLIGNLHLDMGDVPSAQPFIRETGYWSSLGRLSLMKAAYPEAREYYEKLLASAQRNRSANNLFTAYTGLGAACEAMGDDRRAEEYYLKAVNLTEELRSSLPVSQRESFFDVRIDGFLRTSPYGGLARVRVKMNRPLEAFKDSEYTKSRIFGEAMSKWSESTSFDIPQDILNRDRELNDQLAALKKKRQQAYEKANQEIISIIEPQVKEMEGKLQSHIKMLREKHPLFAATKYPEPMDLTETALNSNEWVLAYHVTDPGIIIYLTRGKEIVKALYKPISRNELDALVLQFRKPLEIVQGRDNVEAKLKSFDLAAGKDLSDLLLSDVLEGEGLPKDVPVVVVPDDCLGTLPFETLVLNKGGTINTEKDRLPTVSGAEFFGDRNLISYSQSVTALTLARIHAKSKGAESGLLAIADPVFQEKDERTGKAPKKEVPTGVMASVYKRLGLMAAENDGLMGGLKFPRLNLTGQLAKALAALGKKNAKICTGFEATKTNFLGTIAPQLNQYDEVVFATHGYFGKDLPGIMEPVLVLTLVPPGTDGFLRMTEVMGLNMNADIVALTACQTGLGKRTAGEGTMGMGRAFQYAGAKSVLMSLWSVSEVASTKLVESFFRNLKEGKTKSQALFAARNELRKGVWDHPFFWAGFILVGETN